MGHEILVGLEVYNKLEYWKYRETMSPILLTYGGKFGYDFEVSKTLVPESDNKINRVFTINFPTIEKLDSFFLDQKYISVKMKYFDNSVKSSTIIASYET